MGYTAGDKEEEDEYRRANSEMETICKSAFTALKSKIRGENDATNVARTVEDHKDRAWRLGENDHLDEPETSDLA
ncbi:hypothetical protein [Halocatena halophila]|uniref:hypothetical protein n=1 Tax=Halocatena halophila TaxID=2814576 RepID=UPI002ED1670D